mmetsp:Transcript_16580/g.53678  ORF Transcript_16580/g.53678 Transcript_16580/m.53678 type:complete len:325 (+) Transcript_16580:71-1045(+)
MHTLRQMSALRLSLSGIAAFRLWLDLRLRHRAHVDRVRRALPLPHLVRVRRRHGEPAAVGGKGEGRDRRWLPRELAESLLVGAVPDVDMPVAAARRKGAVPRVVADGVDGEGGADAVDHRPVALEGVLARLRLGARVDVLDGDATLDGPECVAEPARHLRHGPRLTLERRLAPLERLGRPAQVEEVDVPRRRRDHHERRGRRRGAWRADAERKHLVRLGIGADARLRRPHVPQLERAVPAAAHASADRTAEANATDARGVPAEHALHARLKPVQPQPAVRCAAQHAARVDKVDIEQRRRLRQPDYHVGRGHVVQPQRRVPARDG